MTCTRLISTQIIYHDCRICWECIIMASHTNVPDDSRLHHNTYKGGFQCMLIEASVINQ